MRNIENQFLFAKGNRIKMSNPRIQTIVETRDNKRLEAIAEVINNPTTSPNTKVMILVDDFKVPRDLAKKLVKEP